MKINKILKNNTVWAIGDTHWGHNNIVKFVDHEGNKIRPWDDILAMEEAMVELWNETVSPNDYVIHLGDVAINRSGYDRVMPRLNGKKILVMGNHDTFHMSTYLEHFQHVTGMITANRCVMTHAPIHTDSVNRFGINVHGHLHSNRVLDKDGFPNHRYLCLSAERTVFKPVDLNQAVQDAYINLAKYQAGVDTE